MMVDFWNELQFSGVVWYKEWSWILVCYRESDDE